MSKSFFPAVVAVVALALCGAPASLLAAEAVVEGPQISAEASKAMLAVQQAAEAQQYAEVIAKVDEVLKIAGKTPADTLVAYQFLAHAYDKLGNRAGVLTAMQGQLDSGYPDAAEQNRLNTLMTRVAYELKDYPKAAESGSRLIRSGAADPAIYGLVGNSLFQQGKNAESAKLLGDHVAEQERGGVVPREATLNTLFSAQEKVGDKPGVTDTLERLVVHYPKPDYWKLLLFSMNRDPALTDRQVLQIYRLMQATQTLNRCGEVTEMAEISVNAGMPGEGLKVVEQGIAGKVCAEKADQDRLQRLLATATTAATEDKAGLAKLEGEAKAAKNGELDVVLGSSLFGYGEFARSVEALSRATTKGGLKNLPEAQLMLGMAQARAGSKTEAVQTFRSIKADDPFTQRVARLWALHAAR